MPVVFSIGNSGNGTELQMPAPLKESAVTTGKVRPSEGKLFPRGTN